MANISPFAGKTLPKTELVDVASLVEAFYHAKLNPSLAAQRVAFGTSGHRGSSLRRSFNEDHIIAICAALCRYRKEENIDGPLFLGIDSHALSAPAQRTAVEVFAGHNIIVHMAREGELTPTPVISHAILTHNRSNRAARADGLVITPSHNPPEDGGIKYNGTHGGPADTQATNRIQEYANALLEAGVADVPRKPWDEARKSENIRVIDFLTPYVADLRNVIDMEAIARSGISIGIDPLGGAATTYWQAIIESYHLNAEIVRDEIDAQFAFMTADWDGQIRMDCSSAYAMSPLIAMAEQFDIAFANDTDADRHGIVCQPGGLMNPNHFLSVAIAYLTKHRPQWAESCRVGKTLVSSALIDRVARDCAREIYETPVGLKWFVDGLFAGTLCFAGEESAGATFLRQNGSPWTTDKDGIILCLLAAEMRAVTGRTPAETYQELTKRLGAPVYHRMDARADQEQKKRLQNVKPEDIVRKTLGGDPIIAISTRAPGNGAPLGGIKISSHNGWFAARPSGTEDVYKIYAESFKGDDHLKQIEKEAQETINALLQ